VNGTARVQTVSADTAPLFHRLISSFERLTGVPVVLNTSFNIKGQPIVETPLDALSTFASTGMDALFLGPFVVRKQRKPRGKPVKKV
jgi:carbamoyltransferase